MSARRLLTAPIPPVAEAVRAAQPRGESRPAEAAQLGRLAVLRCVHGHAVGGFDVLPAGCAAAHAADSIVSAAARAARARHAGERARALHGTHGFRFQQRPWSSNLGSLRWSSNLGSLRWFCRPQGAAAAAAADARALEAQTHAALDLKQQIFDEPEAPPAAELSKEKSAGWRLDPESGAWVHDDAEQAEAEAGRSVEEATRAMRGQVPGKKSH